MGGTVGLLTPKRFKLNLFGTYTIYKEKNLIVIKNN